MLFGHVHCAPIHYQIFTRSCYLAKCTVHQYNITKSLPDHVIWPCALCTNTTLPNLYQIILFGQVRCAPIQHYQIFTSSSYLAKCTVHQYITKSLPDHVIWPCVLCTNTVTNLYQIMLFSQVHCAPIHYQIFTKSCYLAMCTVHQYITTCLPDHVIWPSALCTNTTLPNVYQIMLLGHVHCAPIQHYQIFTRSCYLAMCTVHQYITTCLPDHVIWPSALCTNTTLPHVYQIMLFGQVHCAPIQHYQIFTRSCSLGTRISRKLLHLSLLMQTLTLPLSGANFIVLGLW